MPELGEGPAGTRAIELAAAAIALVRQHMATCDKDRAEDRADRQDLRDTFAKGLSDIHERIDQVHARINDDRRGSGSLRLRIAAGIIAVLLAIIGFLFSELIRHWG